MADEQLIAVFVDFENLAIGVRDLNKGKFQIDMVLRRLLEKGRIVFKRAYCDWKNYREATAELHRHGVEMVDIPGSKMSGKNSADIRMVTDAIDLCYSKDHIDVFALVSGDSDFSPLASKLKENNKRVIGCGVKSSTSDLLMESCDEFILYDDLVRASRKLFMQPISLEVPQDEDDNRTLGDLIPDTQSEPPEEIVGNRLQRETIDQALAELPWREARVRRALLPAPHPDAPGRLLVRGPLV